MKYKPKITTPYKYKYLYVNIDDTYLNTMNYENKKKNKYKNQFRVTCIHQGVDHNGNYINQSFLTFNIRNPEINFYEQFKNHINKLYGDLNHYEIIVCGDGAKWIKKLKQELNAKYLIDKFHLFRKVRQTFNYYSKNKTLSNPIADKRNKLNYQLYSMIIELFENNNIDQIIKILDLAIKNEVIKSKKQEIRTLKNYILNNYEGINNLFDKSIPYRKCLTETYVKSIIKFKYRQNALNGYLLTKSRIETRTILVEL